MSTQVDKILNTLAGEIVLLDDPDFNDLKQLMDLTNEIHHESLAEAVSIFKTALLDAATNQGTGKEQAIEGIRQSFADVQAAWEQVIAREKAAVAGTPSSTPAPPSDTSDPATPSADAAAAPEEPATPDEAAPIDLNVLDEDAELLSGFVQESQEHLDSIENNVLEWENNPDDLDIVNAIFRPFHTIKGMAGFLNLKEIQTTAHELENLLDAAREGRIGFSQELADLILKGVDILGEMIQGVDLQLQGKSAPSTIRKSEAIINHVRMVLDNPDVLQDVPRMGEILLKEKAVKPDELSDALIQQYSGDKRLLGEILMEEKKVSPEKVVNALNVQANKARQSSTAKSLRVDTSKMDILFDMVGELVITNNMLRQNPHIQGINDRRMQSDLSQLKRITDVLQNVSLSMRMVPIGATFQKMRRVVYDLAKKSGKKIRLKISGEGTEIDRTLVDSLYDPLLHMVRNSCDHGIEMPKARAKAGKDETGVVELLAYHKGGYIFIEIRDDGAGINTERVLAKALEKGLIGEDEELDRRDLLNLIFHPGFSTAANVTDVSGRGVGMDVVKGNITRLGGKVDIQSTAGQGSTFMIKIPLTLAIIDGIVALVGHEQYILPTIHVREALKVEKTQFNRIAGKGETLLVRNRVFPLVRLHDLFHVEDAKTNAWEGIVVLVETESRDVALLVDEITGKQEVVIKNLGEKFKDIQGISGGAILGDGKVGLILDVNQLEKAIKLTV